MKSKTIVTLILFSAVSVFADQTKTIELRTGGIPENVPHEERVVPVQQLVEDKNFTLSTDIVAEWDSNVRRTNVDKDDSVVLIERLSLNYTKEFAHQWSVEATAGKHFYQFLRFPELNFEGSTFDTQVNYKTETGTMFNPRFFLGAGVYDYQDYTRPSSIIQAGVFKGGFDDGFYLFGGDKTVLFYGYTGVYEAASPSEYDRQRHSVIVGVDHTLISNKLSVQGYYRFEYTDYTNVDRQDKNNLVGVSAKWKFNEYLSLMGFANYTDNTSNVQPYKDLETGVVLNASFRF